MALVPSPPPQALRRQRVEVNIELRKAKKDEQILKRRNILFSLMEENLSPEDKRNEVSAGCSAPGQDQRCSLCGWYHLLLGPLRSPAQVAWVKWPVLFLITMPSVGEWFRLPSPFPVLFFLEMMSHVASLDGR